MSRANYCSGDITMQNQSSNTLSVKDRAKRKLERDAREIVSALQDPDTVEIMVNADGRICREARSKITCIGNLQAAQAEAVIKTVAGYHGKATWYNPIIEGEFPLTTLVLPTIATGSYPYFCHPQKQWPFLH